MRSAAALAAVSLLLAAAGELAGPAALFWSCVGLLFYGQLGYPAALLLLARLRPRPCRRAEGTPGLSLLIVAHDEGSRIDARLANALALDYPRERLELVLASDGSSDDTVERARRYEARGVRVLAFPVRRGKPSVLNQAIPACRGEVVVLADARQCFDAGALRALAAPFADPAVGAVSGELVLEGTQGSAAGAGVGFYWRIEKLLRAQESRLDSCVGATGAIYALRRELFEPIPPDTILDDVVIPLRIVRRGYRVVFEAGARAFDEVAGARQEFRRKARTIAGNFQLFARERWLLSPRANRLWLQTVSHKLLRLPMPLLLGCALVSNVALAASGAPFYQASLAGQLAFYAAAWFGRERREWTPSSLRRATAAAHVVCLLALATLVGFHRFLSDGQAATWERASEPRTAS